MICSPRPVIGCQLPSFRPITALTSKEQMTRGQKLWIKEVFKLNAQQKDKLIPLIDVKKLIVYE